jgi:hypothetical protein
MSDEQVQSKHEEMVVENPLGVSADSWKDFRLIECLNLEFTQKYRHSLGKYSRFFIELEKKKFFATKCIKCNKVYAPARPLCPDCLKVTEWEELSGEGTLETYSAIHYSPGTNGDVRELETPYVLAYVLLDGASTLFPHLLKANSNEVKAGMRVQVAYVDSEVDHPIHLMHFVPMEE